MSERDTCQECGKMRTNTPTGQYSVCPDGHGKLHPPIGQPPSTTELIRRLRASSGNAWDRVPYVRKAIAEMRGQDEADESTEWTAADEPDEPDEPEASGGGSLMQLFGLFEGSPIAFGGDWE